MSLPSVANVDDDAVTATTRRSGGRRARVVVITALVLALTAIFYFFPLTTYAYQPGSARPTEPFVSLDGKAADADGAEDGIFFTTVSVGRAVPLDLVRSWFDDSVQIRSETEVYGSTPPSVSRARAREQMEASKLIAAYVALDRTGHEPRFTGTGALVVDLIEDSPSDGLLAAGDVIIEVDGTAVRSQEEVRSAIATKVPGDTVALRVRTGPDEDREERRSVRLGSNPEEEGRAILGVQLATQDRRLVADVDIELDSGRVSGPSAGLAWTLAVIDELTDGDLNGGKPVAVTGEIAPDGSVLPIGGIAQKLVTVQRAGIERFIYPSATDADEVAELRRRADDVELIPVANVDEAVAALAPDGLEGFTASAG